MKSGLSMLNAQEYSAAEHLTLPDLWNIVRRRRTAVVTVLLAVLLVAITYCLFSTRE